jgi:hypothetical protein
LGNDLLTWLAFDESEVILFAGYAVLFVCSSCPRFLPSKNMDLRMLSWSAQKPSSTTARSAVSKCMVSKKLPSR